MSVTHVGAELRRLVVERAGRTCEYCLISEDDSFFGCEVDHIISEKHGGPTLPDNLAYACVICNQAKGSDIGSIDPQSGELCRFFNPRRDRWSDHFEINGYRLDPRTAVGRVTARILGFNALERLLERAALGVVGRFPPGSPSGTN